MTTTESVIRFVSEGSNAWSSVQTGDILLYVVLAISLFGLLAFALKLIYSNNKVLVSAKHASNIGGSTSSNGKLFTLLAVGFAIVATISASTLIGNNVKANAESGASISPNPIEAVVSDSGTVTINNATLSSSEDGYALIGILDLCDGIQEMPDTSLQIKVGDNELYNGPIPQDPSKKSTQEIYAGENTISLTINNMGPELAKSLINKDVFSIWFVISPEPVPPANYYKVTLATEGDVTIYDYLTDTPIANNTIIVADETSYTLKYSSYYKETILYFGKYMAVSGMSFYAKDSDGNDAQWIPSTNGNVKTDMTFTAKPKESYTVSLKAEDGITIYDYKTNTPIDHNTISFIDGTSYNFGHSSYYDVTVLYFGDSMYDSSNAFYATDSYGNDAIWDPSTGGTVTENMEFNAAPGILDGHVVNFVSEGGSVCDYWSMEIKPVSAIYVPDGTPYHFQENSSGVMLLYFGDYDSYTKSKKVFYANASTGKTFSGWFPNDDGTVTADMNITATFADITYHTVTLNFTGDITIYDYYTDDPITETTITVPDGTEYEVYYNTAYNMYVLHIGAYDSHLSFYAKDGDGNNATWNPSGKGTITTDMTFTATV